MMRDWSAGWLFRSLRQVLSGCLPACLAASSFIMADRGSALATLSSTSVPPARPPQPLGDLVHLPEGPLAHLCSFLPCRDVGRLQGSCAALHHSPGCFPSRLRLRRPSWMKRIERSPYGITATAEEMEEEARCCSEAASRLAGRGARSLQELCFGDAYLIEPFFKEVRARNVRLGLLASVKCQCPGWLLSGWPGADSEQLFCEAVAAGQLPALRELILYLGRSPSFGLLGRALGQGVCPRLEKFEVWWSNIHELEAMGAALEARARTACCVSLKSVRVALPEESRWGHQEEEGHQQVVEAVVRGLAPWHGSLEELGLMWVSAGQLASVVALLVAFDWASIQSLTLVIDGAPSGDSLLRALARGAAPNLTSLDVSGCNCSDRAWSRLGEAMGPEGECLRRLKALKLVQMFRGPAQLELFTRAVGEGHGCPQLESLSMALDLREVDDNGDLVGEVEGPWAGALGHAFRPPQGLPRLKQLQLELTGLWDLDELAEVLRSRPHAVQPIESLIMRSCPFDSAEVLGRAMAEGASLGGLKELLMEPAEDQDDDGMYGPYWSSELVEALARGAGQQLERIELRRCDVLSATVNRLLQALAWQAACPRLRCLTVQLNHCYRGDRALDMASLGAILTGGAACSAMLKELDLHATQLGCVEPGALEVCLCHPNVMELEVLKLCVVVDKPASDAIQVLDALGGRAGSRLRQLALVLERPDQTSRVGKALWDADASAVEDHLADIVAAGSLPLIAPMDSWGRQALCVTSAVGGYRHRALEVKAEQALRKREEARWLSSWS